MHRVHPRVRALACLCVGLLFPFAADAHDGPHAHPRPARPQETPVDVDPTLAESFDASLSGGIPDLTFCELYGLQQFGRSGSVVGLALATTSWNVGSRDLMWLNSPDSRHPFIVQNIYRLKNDRFEQIGQSWIKHGFFALGNSQCETNCTFEPGHGPGDWLGVGCTDTYDAFLNAEQSNLGPREEVNPWTAAWTFSGSHNSSNHSHTPIAHRLQVHDNDFTPSMNVGAVYYAEGYYVHFEDINVMNSAAHKSFTVSGNPGGTWSLGMSGFATKPSIGFAINKWTGATRTTIAEELPVDELTSPDGRCILAAKPTDLGNGRWHYEFALLNIDMHRKVKSFSIPILDNATPENIGFSAVQSHGESFSNDPWTASVGTNCQVGDRCITWTTTSNPLRWGTLYNFRFDIDSPPASGGLVAGSGPFGVVALEMFEPGSPTWLTGATVGPEFINPIPAASTWSMVILGLLVVTAATLTLASRYNGGTAGRKGTAAA